MKEIGRYECGQHKARGLDSGGEESNGQHTLFQSANAATGRFGST